MTTTVSHTFRVDAPIETVFPLFDPVNEAEWAEGWQYAGRYPVPFETRRNAVFEVPQPDATELWVVLRFDPQAARAEYLAVRPGRMVRRIAVACDPDGGGTLVGVRYELTALDADATAAAARYDHAFLAGWEEPVRAAAARRREAA